MIVEEREEISDDGETRTRLFLHVEADEILRRLGRAAPEEVASVRRLSEELFDRRSICRIHLASVADVWTLRRGGETFQFIHYNCRVGTGYAPEGALAMIRVSGDETQLIDMAVAEESYADEDDDIGSGIEGPLPVAVHGSLAFHRLSEDLVAIVGEDARVTVFDLAKQAIALELEAVPGAEQVELLALTASSRHLLQLNRDGRFHVYGMAGGQRLLEGLYVDDEVVVYDPELNFQATPEGARHVHFKYPGDRHLYSLDQLGARYGQQDLVGARLRSGVSARAERPEGARAMPPRIDGVAIENATLRARAVSAGNLDHVSVFRDGVEVARLDVDGPSLDIEVALDPLPETRWFAVRAADRGGLVSRTHSVAWQGDDAPARGRLFVLAVGTDLYDDRRIANLKFAGQDARGFADAVARLQGGLYAGVQTEVIENAPDLAHVLPQRLAALAKELRPEDTLMLHVAGHGFRGADGGLFLAGRDTTMDDLTGTALDWKRVVAALSEVRGRTVVFIDACHSGAAEAATNDDAIKALFDTELPFAMVAASKGRQLSHEGARYGGGAFTASVLRALSDRAASDLDGNGAIELSELYAAIKRDVVLATGGEQTPWVARSGFVGEVPLF